VKKNYKKTLTEEKHSSSLVECLFQVEGMLDKIRQDLLQKETFLHHVHNQSVFVASDLFIDERLSLTPYTYPKTK
jgi:hypothetical protein